MLVVSWKDLKMLPSHAGTSWGVMCQHLWTQRQHGRCVTCLFTLSVWQRLTGLTAVQPVVTAAGVIANTLRITVTRLTASERLATATQAGLSCRRHHHGCHLRLAGERQACTSAAQLTCGAAALIVCAALVVLQAVVVAGTALTSGVHLATTTRTVAWNTLGLQSATCEEGWVHRSVPTWSSSSGSAGHSKAEQQEPHLHRPRFEDSTFATSSCDRVGYLGVLGLLLSHNLLGCCFYRGDKGSETITHTHPSTN